MLEKRLQNYNLGRSSGTHGKIWCECFLANLCRVRQRLYEAMLHDPELLLSQRYPYNVPSLQEVRPSSVQIGLATMSSCLQVPRILKVLGLSNALNLVSREMMSNMANLRVPSMILHRFISEDDNSKGETLCNSHGRLGKVAKSG
jgi:hypothetical protein